MDLVHGGGPRTRGPCFVLYRPCRTSQPLVITSNNIKAAISDDKYAVKVVYFILGKLRSHSELEESCQEALVKF